MIAHQHRNKVLVLIIDLHCLSSIVYLGIKTEKLIPCV